MKQRSFYILATLPFFSLAFGLLTVTIAHELLQSLPNNKTIFTKLRTGSYFLLAISLAISFFAFGKTGRDKHMIADIHSIIEKVHNHTIIGLSKEKRKEWSLYGYFARLGHVSLDWKTPNTRTYLLAPKNTTVEIPPNYKKTNIKLFDFDLFQRKKTAYQ